MDGGDPGRLTIRVSHAPHPADLQGRVLAFLGGLAPAEREHFRPPASSILGSALLLAVEDAAGAVHAIGGWQAGEAHVVLFLAVRQAIQRRGWGRRIMDLALRLVPDGMAVTLTVAPDNLPALALYQGMGFREVARAIHMELPIPVRGPIHPPKDASNAPG